MTQDGALAEPRGKIWLQRAVQLRNFRFAFRCVLLPLDTLTQTSYISNMSGAFALDFFFAHATHENLLLTSSCTIANPFQAIKQTSFSRKAEAFTAENVEHAESEMGILMLYLSDLCVLCGKMQTLVSDALLLVFLR